MNLQWPGPTAMSASTERVSVRVGTPQRQALGPRPARLVVVGLVSDRSELGARFPGSLIRETRRREDGPSVEHLRFNSVQRLDALPGLDGPQPSRVRDAVRSLINMGVDEFDLVLAQHPETAPWDLHRPEVHELLRPFLDQMPGAVLVYPDLGGPTPLGPAARGPAPEALKRMALACHQQASGWRERFQIALADLPLGTPPDELEAFLQRVIGLDLGLCVWEGKSRATARHGWRCAAALVAGLLVLDRRTLVPALLERRVSLSEGRRVPLDRRPLLRPGGEAHPGSVRHVEHLIALRLHRHLDEAVVQGDSSLRRPLGAWPLPALRAAKIVHHRLIATAERFVFRSADAAQAISLEFALRDALSPLVEDGLLTGRRGEGPPTIEGGVDHTPGQPGLHAHITGELRPWSRRVEVRVGLSPDAPPALEVS